MGNMELLAGDTIPLIQPAMDTTSGAAVNVAPYQGDSRGLGPCLVGNFWDMK